MGKTALAMNIVQNASIFNKVPVAVFSLEMSKEQLGMRMLCSVSRVDSQDLRTGFIRDPDWPKLARATGILSEAPIFIDDTPAIGVLEMRAKSRRLKAEHNIGLVVVDYLQLMRAPERIENKVVLNIPHDPRLPIDPIQVMRERFGDDFYIVNFQDSDEADRTFASDPVRFFDMMMRRGQISREQFDQLPQEVKALSLLKLMARDQGSGEPLLTDAERDNFANAFAKTGFTGPINWYRNWTHNWETQEGFDQRIGIPTLFIGAVDDVIIAPEHIEAMKPLVDDLEIHMLEQCGHWSQQEKPDEVNRLMIDWLMRRRA